MGHVRSLYGQHYAGCSPGTERREKTWYMREVSILLLLLQGTSGRIFFIFGVDRVLLKWNYAISSPQTKKFSVRLGSHICSGVSERQSRSRSLVQVLFGCKFVPRKHKTLFFFLFFSFKVLLRENEGDNMHIS